MKMSSTTIYQTALIFASLFSIGLCIKCFQCNSAQYPECRDLTVNDTKSEFFKECVGDYGDHQPFCRKTATEVLDVEGSKRVIRNCGWILSKETGDYCRKSDSDFFKKMSCQCFSDACNSSETISSSIKLPTILNYMFASLLYFMCRY